MTDTSPAAPVPVGLDDGYALTKVALPGDRLTVIPSRARVGPSGVTAVLQGGPRIFEYETGDTVYSAGAVDGAPTHFEGYAWSGLNRVIVQHALQQAGLAGRTVHAVSGLPVSAFYRKSGALREERINKKRDSLKKAVRPLSARPAEIAFHEVIPEALAAWYDHVIVERGEEAAWTGNACLFRSRSWISVGARPITWWCRTRASYTHPPDPCRAACWM